MQNEVALSFSVHRRQVTVCRFEGVELVFATKWELPTDTSQALVSAEGFAREMIERYRPDRVAIEDVPGASERRRAIAGAIETIAGEAGAALWRIYEREIFAAYGEPSVSARVTLRRLALSFFPQLTFHPKLHPGALDAAALGLFVQVSSDLVRIETEGGLDAT